MSEKAAPFGQEFLTLSQASQMLPRFNKRRISVSTLWRWVRYGYHGIYLKHFGMGSRIMVTKETLNEFFAEVAKMAWDRHGTTNFKPKLPRRHYPRTDRQRQIDDARKVLVRAKIIQEAPGV